MNPSTLGWKALFAVGAMAIVASLLAVFQQGLIRPHTTEAALPPQVQGIAVTTTSVIKDRGSETLVFMGTITANKDVDVISETQGRITKMHAHLGDRVRAGSLLFEVDNELYEANKKTAQANFLKSRKDLDRYKALFASGVVSANELESVHLAYASAEAQHTAAQRQYRDSFVKSPIDGIVSAMNVEQGTVVHAGMTVANIVDITRLKIKLNVAEADAFKLRTGDTVEIVTDVYPGISFSGTMSAIGHKADDLHTYPVEIAMTNSSQHPLKAGMFCRVSFTTKTDGEVLSIPREALLGSTRNPKVFVVSDGKARSRDIITGTSRGLRIEVREGLTLGEQVIISGRNLVRDNDPVKVVREAGK
jgi:RND family efflux transporter MFP subunit